MDGHRGCQQGARADDVGAEFFRFFDKALRGTYSFVDAFDEAGAFDAFDAPGGRPEAVARTAKAIAVASLTTMVGFGSLVLSHYPGLRSVGAAAILGALGTALLSITMLPVILQRLHYGGGDHGSKS